MALESWLRDAQSQGRNTRLISRQNVITLSLILTLMVRLLVASQVPNQFSGPQLAMMSIYIVSATHTRPSVSYFLTSDSLAAISKSSDPLGSHFAVCDIVSALDALDCNCQDLNYSFVAPVPRSLHMILLSGVQFNAFKRSMLATFSADQVKKESCFFTRFETLDRSSRTGCCSSPEHRFLRWGFRIGLFF